MEKSTREERRLRLLRRLEDEEASYPSDAEHQAAPPPAKPPRRKSRRLLWVLLICLIGSAALSFAFFRLFTLTTPRELVGKWQVVDGFRKGATMEFRPNGTAVLSMNKSGDEDHYSVKVENKRILLSGPDAKTGKNDTFVQTIIKLTEDELVIRDEDRNTYQMKRIK